MSICLSYTFQRHAKGSPRASHLEREIVRRVEFGPMVPCSAWAAMAPISGLISRFGHVDRHGSIMPKRAALRVHRGDFHLEAGFPCLTKSRISHVCSVTGLYAPRFGESVNIPIRHTGWLPGAPTVAAAQAAQRLQTAPLIEGSTARHRDFCSASATSRACRPKCVGFFFVGQSWTDV